MAIEQNNSEKASEIEVVKVPQSEISKYLIDYANRDNPNRDTEEMTISIGATSFEDKEFELGLKASTSNPNDTTGGANASGGGNKPKVIFVDDGVRNILDMIKPEQIVEINVKDPRARKKVARESSGLEEQEQGQEQEL